MKRLYIGNIAPQATEEELRALFAQHGKVRSLDMPRDIFSGRNRGFAFVDMEGHEARAAMGALNGTRFLDQNLKVREELPKGKGGPGHRR